ncbi:hypothetical protein [Enterococcus sp. AZ007]|uniref:hypothetical protein n=1 Tax=Enterococcus sp. AZ007 TaxID=2774839 RepID=UPI003F2407B9
MKKKTVRKYMYVVYLISIILYCNAPEVSATTEVSMTTEPTNENLIDVSKSLVYPSNLDITNFKGDHVNSGIVKVTSEKTVTLNYGISYYGEGDITLLEVIPSDVENASIQVFNNKDATGLILITVSENFFDTNIVFSVVGGATTYSQTIRLEKVPENENDNIPPITNTPEEPVNPYLNTPKEPVNPETNMPEKPLNPKTNTPEVPANPETNMPEKPLNPKTNTPEVPANPETNIPEKPLNPKTNTPEVPANPETNIPEKPLNPKTNTPEVPANPETNMPEKPLNPKTNTPEVPANPETNIPEKPLNPKTNTPEVPANPKTNMPEKPLNPKFNTPEVPANPDVNSPKAPIDPNIDPAGTDDQNGKEIDMNQKSNKTNSLGRRLLTTSIGNSDFPKKKKLLKYPKTGESQDLWNGSLSVLGVILIILVWKMKEYFSN